MGFNGNSVGCLASVCGSGTIHTLNGPINKNVKESASEILWQERIDAAKYFPMLYFALLHTLLALISVYGDANMKITAITSID